MPLIAPNGDPVAPIWVILDRPFNTDIPRGFLCSGGMGFALQKMFEEAGVASRDVYYLCRRPDTDSPDAYLALEQKIEARKPPLLLVVGESAQYYLSECRASGKADWKMQLNKQAGSLLRSTLLTYPHYMLPIIPIENMMADYAERNIATHLDIGKLREELLYFRAHSCLQPLPQRTLLSHEMGTEEILTVLKSLEGVALACDIETVYPKKGSEYYQKHPGLPVVLALASSPLYAVSFSPWRSSAAESVAVWRALDRVLDSCPLLIGQNFFLFDSRYIGALGFSLHRKRFQDTLLRHHILWPELSHKLQFLCRQYTRQPYYKDDGKQWSMRDMNGLRRYNALDAAITFEVYLGQEEEFKQRPQLRGEVA